MRFSVLYFVKIHTNNNILTQIKRLTKNVRCTMIVCIMDILWLQMGFNFESRLDSDGEIVLYNFYDAYNVPLNSSSGRKKVTFKRITGKSK